MGFFDGIREKVAGLFGSGEREEEELEQGPTEEELDDPQLETDAQIVAHVDRLYKEWYDARLPYEPAWYQNFANFLGFQYHQWDNLGRQLTEGRAPSYRVRMVVNLMMPAVKAYLGKFMRGDPAFRARPGEPSDTAFADARVSDKVLKALWRLLDGTDEELEFLINMIVFGHAFWKLGWDPALGKRVEFPGFPAVQTGELAWDIFGPWPILTPPDQKTIRKPAQLIDARIFPIQWLRQQYGQRVAGVAPDGDLSSMSSYEHRMTTLVSPQVTYGGGGRSKANLNGCIRKEWWSDPETLSESERAKYPHGRLIVVVGGRLVLKEDNPYTKLAKHPFIDGIAEKVPGRFWGASIFDQVAPLQKSYNRGRSQLKEVSNLCSNPVIDVEQGHGITAFTAEPGAIAERKKGWGAPQYRQPPQMTPHQIETVKLDKADFDEVIQIRSASKGEVPSANISGVALELTQDADNNPLTPMALRIARAFSRVMTGTIKIVQEYYTEDRYLEVTGEGQETEIFLFRADRHRSDLRVECIVSSILPASNAARFNRIETATRLGYLDPMKDRALGLRMLQFGDDDQLWELANHDRQLQMRENLKLQQGVPVPTAPWHDHETHILAMMPTMKSAEWDSWPPEVQQVWIAHWTEHLDALAAAMAPAPGGGPALGREPDEPETPAIAGGLGALTQGGEV